MNRRNFLKYFLSLLLYLAFPLKRAISAEDLNIEHPINNPPEYTDKKKCDNCGMDRNKWARTRHGFQNPEGKFYTCSIHCVAALSMKLKEEPANVKAAEYFHPENMLDAKKAVYIMGSALPGTMTKISKVALASEEEAEKIIGKYGGTVLSFEKALSEAKKEIPSHSKTHHTTTTN